MAEHRAAEESALAARLGDGHGRRVLVVGKGAAPSGLVASLARRAWAVSVRVEDRAEALRGRRWSETSGVVADWGVGVPSALAVEDARFAAIACAADPGVADHSVCAALRRALREDGILVFALSKNSPVPELPGFTGTSVAEREGVALVSARRR